MPEKGATTSFLVQLRSSHAHVEGYFQPHGAIATTSRLHLSKAQKRRGAVTFSCFSHPQLFLLTPRFPKAVHNQYYIIFMKNPFTPGTLRTVSAAAAADSRSMSPLVLGRFLTHGRSHCSRPQIYSSFGMCMRPRQFAQRLQAMMADSLHHPSHLQTSS
ncbi:unnamed protein product [Lepidochelys kempii]